MAKLESTKTINLALQGGGSHGAFTWGVLDYLLEDGRLEFEGVSGTSAGAMNAVALANGFAQAKTEGRDARELARESLKNFWTAITSLDPKNSAQGKMWDAMFGGWKFGPQSSSELMGKAASLWFSPYQTNPLDFNPLLDVLEKQIDFPRLAKLASPKVYVTATHVATGRAEVFTGSKLTPKAVMASACLPMLFKAVEINGELYWDGGYSGNPYMQPLINHSTSRDIVLVQINPIKRDLPPDSSEEIMDRMNELTFNASLLAQMRAIDFVQRMQSEGRLDNERYKNLLMHRIDGGEALEAYSAHTKTSAEAKMIGALFELGRQAGKRWLTKHFAHLNQQGTVNIGRDYLGKGEVA
jgi:NTE family protein